MPHIPDELAQELVSLFGARVQVQGDKAVETALRALVDSERHRRGERDVSGAFHALALTQGALLRHEYDLSTHGHYEGGWEIGAIIVDVRELILINQEHGFPAGDRVLAAVASTLASTYPTAKVVRIHSDAFAILLPPSAEVTMSPALEQKTRDALRAHVPEFLSDLKPALDYTVALLHLTLARPSHWQVLGPIVWAECERAHALQRSGRVSGVQQRSIDLDAAVPMTTL